MKIVKQLLKGAIILSLGIGFLSMLIFWAPDTSMVEMRQKYGGGASQFLPVGDKEQIHFRDQGSKTGAPLVFIHGTSASLHTWEPLIRHLGDRYRLISLDLPGHGLTGENIDRDYSNERMVKAIWQLLDHLGIRSATLVGNSLGGAVAWASALDDPERINSLVLLAPSGAPVTTKAKSNIGFKILKTSPGQFLMKKITPRSIIDTSLRQSVEKEEVVTEKMVDRYWELLRLKGNRQSMIDLANRPRDRDAWTRLSEISSPVLLIWGKQDGLLPVSMAITFENEIDNIRVTKLEGIGHLPMEEDSQTVSRLIHDFCGVETC